jgi:HAD superfamily hydrolase (TIGR01549 family)
MNRIGISIDFYETLVEMDIDVQTIAQALTAMGYPCSERVEGIWNSSGFDGQRTCDPQGGTYEAWRRRSLGSLVSLCGAPDNEIDSLVETLLQLDQTWTVREKTGAREFLSGLRRSGVAHCILTNWDYPIAPYLAMAGLPGDVVTVTSADLGVRKPHEDAFAEARRVMDVLPDCHIHIGDDWFADVTGAIRSGAWAVWVVDSVPTDPLPRRIRCCPFTEIEPTVEGLVQVINRA